MSDGTRAAPVNLLRPPPHQLQRNSDPRREVLSAGFGATQKGRGKPVLSSSVSVRETRGLLYQLQRVRAIREGAGIRAAPLSAVLTLARPKTELLVDD